MDAIRTVQAALDGATLDYDILERLSFNISDVFAVRESLVPLLVQLVMKRPELAEGLPEKLFPTLLQGLSLQQALELTGMGPRGLSNDIVRPVLLTELSDKAKTAQPEHESLFAAVFALLVDPALDTPSVSAIERLVDVVPQFAAKYTPFDELFTGSAILQSRLIAVNTRLVKHKQFPKEHFNRLMWTPLEREQDDILLAAIQIDYVGDLVLHFTSQQPIRPYVGQALHELCRRYTSNTQFASTIETVFARLAVVAEVVFLELDAQYSLVTHERPNLLALLPSRYIVEHHAAVVERLELTSSSIYAIVNIVQSTDGLDLLQLTESRITAMPVLYQLMFAAAATTTDHGTHALAQRFPQVVKNAAAAPSTQETRELLATFKRNMLRSIPHMRADAQVAVGI